MRLEGFSSASTPKNSTSRQGKSRNFKVSERENKPAGAEISRVDGAGISGYNAVNIIYTLPGRVCGAGPGRDGRSTAESPHRSNRRMSPGKLPKKFEHSKSRTARGARYSPPEMSSGNKCML